MILQCCYVEQSGANALLAPELAAGIKLREAPAVLLGCALRRSDVAALTDGRCSGGFKPEATVAARRADAWKPSVWCARRADQPRNASWTAS
jgi:hypothetical protein